MTKIIAVFLAVICLASSTTFFNKRTIPLGTGASCLDGSQYAFYYYEPDPVDVKVIPNKLLIYFQETPFGWCIEENLSDSLKKCHTFVQNQSSVYNYGSSNDYAGSLIYLNGILSEQGGGQFSTWPKLLLKSCDGGAYMGNHEPISYKGKKFHFKGSKNVQEALNYIYARGLITSREQVTIAGSMNGGVAALMWANYIGKMTTGKVRVIADAAIYLNQMNFKQNRTTILNRIQTLDNVALQGYNLPNQECQNQNGGSRWKCLFATELINYVHYPVFFTQSLYDGWSIHRVLGYRCAQDTGSLVECKQGLEHIQAYHERIKTELTGIVEKSNSTIGVFSISCVSHEFLAGRWINPEFQVPMQSGNFAYHSYEKWKKGEKVLDIDQVKWPNNTPCHGIKSQALLREE